MYKKKNVRTEMRGKKKGIKRKGKKEREEKEVLSFVL